MSLLPKRSVPEIEQRLTELVETDIRSGEIYELLKQLAAIWVFQNKYVYGYSDIEAVCHDVAADTYMRVLEGRTQITKWMYYIGRSLKLSYITNQKRIEHEVVDTEGKAEQYGMNIGVNASYSLEKFKVEGGAAVNFVDKLVDSKYAITLYSIRPTAAISGVV